MNQVTVACPQGGGQLAVAAAEMNYQATLDARGVEDCPRLFGHWRGRVVGVADVGQQCWGQD